MWNTWLRQNDLGLRLFAEELIANTGCFNDSLGLYFVWVFGSLRTSILCILGELAGRGSVAVVVGFFDRLQVTGDRWHATHDKWHLTLDTQHMTHDMWHVTPDTWYIYIFFCGGGAFLVIFVSFGIITTIGKHQEIQCLLYVGFFKTYCIVHCTV